MLFYNRNHGVSHYVGLSFKTVVLYGFYLVCLFSIPTAQYLAAQITDRDVARAVIGETAITVEVVSSEDDMRKGLSGRDKLLNNHGMLFVFPDVAYHGIWMKDMRFSIDIIWLNEQSEIVYIERNLGPDTYPEIFRPSRQAKYVLEVNSGFVDQHFLRVGDSLEVL
jgi:uncharacterized membrane protein (UPF0127 family)